MEETKKCLEKFVSLIQKTSKASQNNMFMGTLPSQVKQDYYFGFGLPI
jgi:hypothetical protein